MTPETLALLVRVGFLVAVVLTVVIVELVDFLRRTWPRPRQRRYPVAKPYAPPPDPGGKAEG
jgi:hypothetical protein